MTYECYNCGRVCSSYDDLIEHQVTHEQETDTGLKEEVRVSYDKVTDKHVIMDTGFQMNAGVITQICEDNDQSAESSEQLECQISIVDGIEHGLSAGTNLETFDLGDECDLDETDEEGSQGTVTCYECSICSIQYSSYADCEQHFDTVHSQNINS